MTFTLTPLSHYNSIIKPHAHFLLSLLEDLSIDFPSHFITFVLDIYQDTAARDKLIFPLAITRILRHFSIPSPNSPFFTTMGAINASSVKRGPASTEAATNGDRQSCCFYCSSLLLGSFHIYSFFFGSWCDSGGHHGIASKDGCSS